MAAVLLNTDTKKRFCMEYLGPGTQMKKERMIMKICFF